MHCGRCWYERSTYASFPNAEIHNHICVSRRTSGRDGWVLDTQRGHSSHVSRVNFDGEVDFETLSYVGSLLGNGAAGMRELEDFERKNKEETRQDESGEAGQGNGDLQGEG
jgi:hypothetical protein